MIITIDGPSGTGKTTVAKKVAEALGIVYFDTGAMYRAVTWGLQEEGISIEDVERVKKFLNDFDFQSSSSQGIKRYFLQGRDITEQIRFPHINQQVSVVSAKPYVREALWVIQRAYGEKQSAVFEGRDMGSVVFPEAFLRIFLDASLEVRGKRRFEEEEKKGIFSQQGKRASLEEVTTQIVKRDTYDAQRELAPLIYPKGAIRIDTSDLSIKEVVEKIVEIYDKKKKKILPASLHAKRMKPLYRIVLFLAWVFSKLLYRHRVYGLEHALIQGVILAPNHASLLDPPLVAISWPEEIHFLAKQELFRPVLFGRFIRALNSHPVHADVTDVSVFKTILEILKRKENVLLFPEGSRTFDGSFQEIKPGVAMLAIRSKALIVPAYLHGTREIWKRGKSFPKLWGKTACIFGSPIDPEVIAKQVLSEERKESGTEGSMKKKVNRAVGEAISKAFSDLKKWYEEGAKGSPP